ncbi:glycosyltransferase family 2 protein [Synechococcus sp. FGCU-3]|nr:glycosyltransferase family 2 protein [Synechococcus sp. FGCU3]
MNFDPLTSKGLPRQGPYSMPGLVSIVTPAYNAAFAIREAIQSVLLQSYSSWELLIIDDGSTDTTAEVVRSFKDPRIQLIQQRNQGVSAARNCGLDAARGEFITFLDADDALPPRSLEARVQLLQRDPEIDVVDGVFIVCGPELGTELKHRRPGPRGPLLPRLLRLDEQVFRGVCFLFRRHLLGHLRFQAGMSHAEDLLFFIQLAAVHQPIYAPVAEATYRYRTGSSSAMSNLDGWEKGYLQLLQHLHRIPHLSWHQLLPPHRRIARILLATWLSKMDPIRAITSAGRALLSAFSTA